MERIGGDGNTDAEASASAAPPATRTETVAAPRRRRRLAFDLTALAVVGALLIGAIASTGAVLYRQLYSPTAFVLDYLHLLEDHRASDALLVPGVAVAEAEAEAGLDGRASDALLRGDALGDLSDIEPVSEVAASDGTVAVTVSYRVGRHTGMTTFEVERDGSVGPAPTWRFASSPLAVIQLAVRGSMEFMVNGFAIDKRQVSPDGMEADPLEPVALLAFSPGLYSITVDTAVTESPGVAVLTDAPLTTVPVSFQASPTDEFVDVVQRKVDAFLAECATQKVLQPTGCPFGYYVRNRIVEPPTWSITEKPKVALEPDGADWAITRTQAVAEIDVQIRSIFDGSVFDVSEEVPFFITGKITILPDGTASIAVSASD